MREMAGGILFGVVIFLAIPAALIIRESREADQVLRSDFNATPMIEKATPPAQSGRCELYNWWDSPCVFGPKGYYQGQVKGGKFAFEVPWRRDDYSSRTPLERRD